MIQLGKMISKMEHHSLDELLIYQEKFEKVAPKKSECFVHDETKKIAIIDGFALREIDELPFVIFHQSYIQLHLLPLPSFDEQYTKLDFIIDENMIGKYESNNNNIPSQNDEFIHYKHKNKYIVGGIGQYTNGTLAVIYHCEKNPKIIWLRDVDEFCGLTDTGVKRFEKVKSKFPGAFEAIKQEIQIENAQFFCPTQPPNVMENSTDQ
jgi:hypothetical protein